MNDSVSRSKAQYWVQRHGLVTSDTWRPKRSKSAQALSFEEQKMQAERSSATVAGLT